MAKGKERQALAIRDVVERASKISVPCIMDGANRALQIEAARVFAQSEEKRMNGGANWHIVLKDGNVSGYAKAKDGALVQFSGAALAVTAHD